MTFITKNMEHQLLLSGHFGASTYAFVTGVIFEPKVIMFGEMVGSGEKQGFD